LILPPPLLEAPFSAPLEERSDCPFDAEEAAEPEGSALEELLDDPPDPEEP
jgi:hypothetical protein